MKVSMLWKLTPLFVAASPLLSAPIASRTKPASLAEVRSKAHPTWAVQQNTLRDIVKNLQGKAAASVKQLSEIGAKLEVDTEKAVSNAGTKVDDTERDISAAEKALQKMEQDNGRKATKIMSGAFKLNEDIEGSEADLVTEAEDISDELAGETTEFDENVEESSDGLIESATSQEARFSQGVETMAESNTEHLQSEVESKQEDIAAVGEDISQLGKDSGESVKGLNLGVREIEKVAKDLKKSIGSTEDLVDNANEKVQSVTGSYASDLDNRVQKSLTTVKKTAGSVDKIMKAEIGGIQKALGKELKDVGKLSTDKRKELIAAIGATGTEQLSGLTSLKSSVNENLAESWKKLETMETNTANLAGKAQKLGEKATSSLDEMDAGLSTAERELRDGLKKKVDAFDQGKDNMLGTVRGRVTEMREKVVGGLEKATANTVNEAKGMAAEVQQGIQTGVDQSTAAFDVIDTQVNTLGQEFNQYRTKLVTDKNALGKIKEVMEREAGNVGDAISQAKSVALADIQDKSDKYTLGMQQADETVQTVGAKLREESKGLVEQLKANMGKDEEQFVGDLTKGTADTTKLVEGNQVQIGNLVKDLGIAVATEDQATNDMKPELETAAKLIEKNLNDVRAEATGIKGELRTKSQEIMNNFADRGGKVSEEAGKALSSAKVRLDGKLDEVDKKLEQRYGDYMETLADTKANSETEFNDMKKRREALLAETGSLEKSSEEVETEVEEMGSTNEDKVSKAAQAIKDAGLSETAMTEEEGTKLEALMKQQFGDSWEEVQKTLLAKVTEEKKALSAVETKWNGAISNHEAEVEKTEDTETAQLESLSEKVNHLGSDVAGQEKEVQQYLKSNSDKVDRVKKEVNDGVNDIGKKVEEEKESIAERGSELKGKVDGMMTKFTEEQKSNFDAAKSELDGVLKDDKDRAAEMVGGLEKSGERWSNKVSDEIKDVTNSGKLTKDVLGRFLTAESNAESGLRSKVTGLETSIEVVNQGLTQAVQDQEQETVGESETQINGMEGVLGLLKKAAKGANMSIEDFKAKFGNELASYVQKAKHSSHELEQQLKHVEESEGDLAGEFTEETQPSREQLMQLAKQLTDLVAESSDEMGNFETRLNTLKTSREKQATDLHEKTSALKRTSLDQMSHTVDTIHGIGEYADNMFAKVQEEQKEYDAKLAKISGFTAEHDDSKLDELEAKAFKLDATHKQLKDWQRTEKHQTRAWRNEVDRNLAILEKKMEGEQASIENDQMDSETALNKNLRSMKQGAEGDMRIAAEAGAKEVGQVFSDIQGKMSKVLSTEEADEASGHSAIDRVENGLRANEQEAASEIEGAHEHLSSLQSAAGAYREKVMAAEQQLSAKLNPDEKGDYAVEVSKLKQNLNKLASLLEMHDESFLETEESTESESSQVLALRSLNAELRRENAELRHQDEHLETRAASIAQALAKRGIKV